MSQSPVSRASAPSRSVSSPGTSTASSSSVGRPSDSSSDVRAMRCSSGVTTSCRPSKVERSVRTWRSNCSRVAAGSPGTPAVCSAATKSDLLDMACDATPAMATRLTYTTGSRSPELDRAFEAALADARGPEAGPLEHLVGGRDSTVGELFAREDPSRREHVASRAHEGAELASEAVEAARAAQRAWRRLPHAERVEVLRAAQRLIDERKLALAAAISMEVGKVRTESIAEVEEAIDLIETYCRQIE